MNRVEGCQRGGCVLQGNCGGVGDTSFTLTPTLSLKGEGAVGRPSTSSGRTDAGKMPALQMRVHTNLGQVGWGSWQGRFANRPYISLGGA